MLSTMVARQHRTRPVAWLALLRATFWPVLLLSKTADGAAFLFLASSTSRRRVGRIQRHKPCRSFVRHNHASSDDAADTELPHQRQRQRLPLEQTDLGTTTATTTSTSTAAARTITTNAKSIYYLLSLQWSDDPPSPSSGAARRRFAPAVRSLWRWKDAVLGDGRDFFVPKPKIAAALQSYLSMVGDDDDDDNDPDADTTTTTASTISECVVLSNCARFEILLVMTNDDKQEQQQQQQQQQQQDNDPVFRISSRLVAQVESYHRKQGRFQIQMPFDWPAAIDLDAYQKDFLAPNDGAGDPFSISKEQQQQQRREAVDELARHWTVVRGPDRIARHLSLVAAGLAPRPRRPDRPVAFRPFSSRDAHIMLQLKRALRAAANQQLLSALLRGALRAGKAARNPAVVPELVELRQRYGTGNSKFDVAPPAEVSRRVAAAARAKAIDPAVQECVEQLRSVDFADQIRSFRERAMELSLNEAERAFIQKRIHEPTLQLRKGVTVDVSSILETLSNELEVSRQREAAHDLGVT